MGLSNQLSHSWLRVVGPQDVQLRAQAIAEDPLLITEQLC